MKNKQHKPLPKKVSPRKSGEPAHPQVGLNRVTAASIQGLYGEGYAITVTNRTDDLILMITPGQAEQLKANSPDRSQDIYTPKEYMEKFNVTASPEQGEDPDNPEAIRGGICISRGGGFIGKFPTKERVEEILKDVDIKMLKATNKARFIVMGEDDYICIEPL